MNFIDFLFLYFSAPTFLIVGMAIVVYTNTKPVNSRKNVTNLTVDTHTLLKVCFFISLETDPFQQMMKSLMSQHNPLHTGQKVFKKKPNPKFNKQEGN